MTSYVDDNIFPKLILVEGTTPTSPSSGDQKLFIDSADHKLKRVNSSGVVTVIDNGTPDRVVAYQTSAATSLANGVFTSVLFDANDTSIGDRNGSHSTVTNTSRITCQVAGPYRIQGSARFATAAGGDIAAKLLLNGTTQIGYKEIGLASGTFGAATLEVTAYYQLSATDYVELQIYQGSGGAINTVVGRGNTWFAMGAFL